jgi:hypothetical protein
MKLASEYRTSAPECPHIATLCLLASNAAAQTLLSHLLGRFQPMTLSNLVIRPRSRDAFRDALNSALKQNKDSASSLLRAISRFNKNDYGLLSCWITGISTPKRERSYRLLRTIELHYRLPTGHFKSILRTPSPREQYLKSIYSFEKALLDWHLPDDFDSRSDFERREIIEWIRVSIRKGSTDSAAAARTRWRSIVSLGDVTLLSSTRSQRPAAMRWAFAIRSASLASDMEIII